MLNFDGNFTGRQRTFMKTIAGHSYFSIDQITMAKVCQLTGKRPSAGNNRSHSLRATRRRFLPNLSKKTIVDPVSGKKLTVKISTRAQKTLVKNPGKFKSMLKKLVKKSR